MPTHDKTPAAGGQDPLGAAFVTKTVATASMSAVDGGGAFTTVVAVDASSDAVRVWSTREFEATVARAGAQPVRERRRPWRRHTSPTEIGVSSLPVETETDAEGWVVRWTTTGWSNTRSLRIIRPDPTTGSWDAGLPVEDVPATTTFLIRIDQSNMPSGAGTTASQTATFRLAPEVGMYPLWQTIGDELVNLDPEDWPVPADLRDRMLAWDELFQASYDLSDPGNSGWSSPFQALWHLGEGREIATLLRDALGGTSVEIGFDPDGDQDPGTDGFFDERAAVGEPEVLAQRWRDLGARAHRLGDSAGAWRWWILAAEAGDVDAMHHLGALAFDCGDTRVARRWLMRAARHGHLDARYDLGKVSAAEGHAGEADEWWKAAVDAGHTASQVDPARSTGSGSGGDPYRSSPLCHDLDRISSLGTSGTDAAIRWWALAAVLGHDDAAIHLGLHFRRAGCIAEARRWFTMAAERRTREPVRDHEAGLPLEALADGAIEAGDTEEAKRCLLAGAENGSTSAMVHLGERAAADGDVMVARQWFERASIRESGDATRALIALDEAQGDTTGDRSPGDPFTRVLRELNEIADADPDILLGYEETPVERAVTVLESLSCRHGDDDSLAVFMERVGTQFRMDGDIYLARLWWTRAAVRGNEAAEITLGLLPDL